MDDGPPEDNFNSPLGSTDGFYEGMERINAVSLSFETKRVYYERLLACWKMDIESARRLHKKHFMAEMSFIKIVKFIPTAWGHS